MARERQACIERAGEQECTGAGGCGKMKPLDQYSMHRGKQRSICRECDNGRKR